MSTSSGDSKMFCRGTPPPVTAVPLSRSSGIGYKLFTSFLGILPLSLFSLDLTFRPSRRPSDFPAIPVTSSPRSEFGFFVRPFLNCRSHRRMFRPLVPTEFLPLLFCGSFPPFFIFLLHPKEPTPRALLPPRSSNRTFCL